MVTAIDAGATRRRPRAVQRRRRARACRRAGRHRRRRGAGAGGGGADDRARVDVGSAHRHQTTTPAGPTPPAFVAKGLEAPSSITRRALARTGLKASLTVGVLGARVRATLTPSGPATKTKAKKATAPKPILTRTTTATGAIALTLKTSSTALKRYGKVKLEVTVTPPAGVAAKPITLTRTIALK